MEKGGVIKRADPSSIHDKFLVGYQGWFTCAGDGEPIDPGHHGWLHWFNHPIPDGGKPNTDLWPDVSEYSPSELFPAPGINYKTGEQAFLFSSRHPKTVQRHFHWMARHGVDGAFLQRFVGQCDVEHGSRGLRKQRDEIGDNVREAAEKEGRVFAIMYDVSGVPADRVARVIEHDWAHLIRDKGILDSPNYLREKGKPVLALWGFGFSDRGHTPELVRNIVRSIRSFTPGGAYIMAGAPTHWRKGEGDADPNPGFVDVYLNEFDCISPWMVGRISKEEDSDHFLEHIQKPDMELLRKSHEEHGRRKVDYIPVVFPGFSGLNLSEGEWKFNQIPRNGGKLLWQQIFNAKRLGVRTIYGAMWDEYDEGTAFMPVVEKARHLPVSEKYTFLALDADGYDLPADWYMRICGFAAEGLKSERMIHETFPSKELQDFWSSRPKYEQTDPGGSGEVEVEGSRINSEPPPPPYSLENDTPQPAQPATSHQEQQSQTAAAPVPGSAPVDAAVSSVADDFARQTMSDSTSAAPVPSTSTRPPLHPSHPSNYFVATTTAPVLPPPSHPSRPPLPGRNSSANGNLSSRPSVNYNSRPSIPARPSSSASNTSIPSSPPPIPSVPRPTGTPQPHSPSSQWPPADWNVGGSSNPSHTSILYIIHIINMPNIHPIIPLSTLYNLEDHLIIPHILPAFAFPQAQVSPTMLTFPGGPSGPSLPEPAPAGAYGGYPAPSGPPAPHAPHPYPSGPGGPSAGSYDSGYNSRYNSGYAPSGYGPRPGPHDVSLPGSGSPGHFPQPHPGLSSSPAPSGWSPSTSPAPSLPSRPPSSTTHSSWSSYPGQQQPTPSAPLSQNQTSSSSSSGTSNPGGIAGTAYGYAAGAIDRFGGKKLRGELEERVGSLAKGSKLLGKFSK
ncbi:hypothetical protein D9758_012849 [Tetrapyrgos nigripes]|uniref:Xylosidase/arabinosidase n=1 Tax=Tetrapyrgos nigripes TaxID=182062 RepID=A0A8H5CB40_9AGAR|nr:hypothetical protein D9758_012849 [Tetrapyrgos nigripes]